MYSIDKQVGIPEIEFRCWNALPQVLFALYEWREKVNETSLMINVITYIPQIIFGVLWMLPFTQRSDFMHHCDTSILKKVEEKVYFSFRWLKGDDIKYYICNLYKN